MSSITIPYHLAIPCFISLVLLLTFSLKRKSWFRGKKWAWTSLMVFLTVYAAILICVIYLNEHYHNHLQSFDLNNDGVFSAIERTPEQQKAFGKVIADNAINLSFITGLIFAFIIALATYIIGKVYDLIVKSWIISCNNPTQINVKERQPWRH